MKSKHFSYLFISFLLISISNLVTTAAHDTLFVYELQEPPLIDGNANETCWHQLDWHQINHVWIPWGDVMDTLDFHGQYKTAWCAETNLLYFLIEVIDDEESDAYSPGASAPIFNFDMFEIFIDEDRSGGYHVFDGKADDETELGYNAENAFAYHIFTPFPADGDTTGIFYAEDIAGQNWGNMHTCDYRKHFPDFICRKEGNRITWELSLIVFNDNYTEEDKELSRVKLCMNKVLGISLAYNDDDQPEVDPQLTVRDHFIGSVQVTREAYNDHWKNARDFQTAMLKGKVIR